MELRSHHLATGELTRRGPGMSESFVSHDATSLRTVDLWDIGYVTIDMLPNEVLLDIFDHCVDEEEWQKQSWYMCVKGGDASCLGHPVASNCD
jgi:hypothetical protein